MAAYLRQSGQVSLLLSEAEANALRALGELALDENLNGRSNGAEKAAADRALQALAASTNRSARTAGYFI